MKMAPMADLYVARVAKDSADLECSSETIAKVSSPYVSNCANAHLPQAIAWASQEFNADVISMSFGFADEEIVEGKSPLKAAIHQAVLDRGDKVLFFAAAGNDGANQKKVMFPARHDLMIPIYGTSANGEFLDSLNPRIKLDESSIFGTLAQNLPCAGLSNEGEVSATGTSFATAIAAGLAAMILEYAQISEKKKTEDCKG
jgi:subtilisin family serine protease